MEKITAILIVISCLHNGNVFGLTGGEPANDGEFPFIVSVKNINYCYVMAGTILAPKWILSNAAGHMSLPGGFVGFGSNDLVTNLTKGYCGGFDTSKDRAIYNYYTNEAAWVANPWTHDLILILLKEAIPFGDNVQPVRLPQENEPWPSNEIGTMLGWGYEGGKTPAVDIHLKKAEVSIYSDEYCSNSSLWNGQSVFNPAVMKCGGEAYKTFFCVFDYGGPLIINGTQYGIISYAYVKPGGDCGEFLGIFAPTVTYRDWIRELTGI